MFCAALLAGGAAISVSAAEEAEESDAKKEAEKKELTPEQYFEGGTETYENWVELGVGGLITRGNRAQAEQSRRFSRGAFGGIEDLHYQTEAFTNVLLTVDGRALFDQNDYKLTLGLTREEKWFLRVHYEEFRTWYNAHGGYFPPTDRWYAYRFGDDALALDRGEVSVEGGLTLKNWPALTFKYTHQYRDGEKGSTSWGQSHPILMDPRSVGLVPSFYDIDEERDIFELNATHRIKATELGLGLRYETGDLDNARKMWQWPGEGALAGESKITDRQGSSYDLFSAHAFSETWIKKNLFFSAGFLFVNLDSDFSGSRIYNGRDFDVGYTPGFPLGYTNLLGGAQKQEYVLNLSLMSTAWKHFTIVPSLRVQKECLDADSFGMGTQGNAVESFTSRSDRDVLDVRERLDVRYTGLTNWVFSARGEWTQGEGDLQENDGLSRVGVSGVSPIRRDTEDSRFFQKYSAGVRWYPARKVTVDMGGYYKKNAYDYDHRFDDTPNTTGNNRYPAYLVMQDFETFDGNARLTLRPWKNVTLVSRYEYQVSTIHTKPDQGSKVESSEMTSHILAQNVSWTPWSRLYLQAGFNYVLSETETPTSDYTQAVLDSQNNYWTLNFNAGLVLDNKTDLNVGYTYYRADNYKDNSLDGVPFGVGAEEHGVTATIVRRLTERLRLTLRYGYFHYEDETSGGNNDYEAHLLYSSLQYRF